MVKVDGDVLKR